MIIRRALVISCAALLAVVASGMSPPASAASTPASPPADILKPSLSIPNAADRSRDQYYVLLLRWSRAGSVGPVTARVTYLNPDLFLAWLRQSSQDVTQQQLQAGLDGFPGTLRFRVAFRATDRRDIQARKWVLALRSPNGKTIPDTDGHRIAPVDLKTDAGGDYWEENWDYRFRVPETFLADAGGGIDVVLTGPAGSALLHWAFGRATAATDSAEAYVPYLGGALVGVSMLLVLALVLTRPPRTLWR